jgi:CheY-like chemotaxis protein
LKSVIAEDEAINRLYLTRMLQSAGLEVVAVKDGQAALEETERERRPDFILMDITMPRMTGTEACRIIRAEEAEKGLSPVPIIALTAHARTEDRAACAEAGMDGFIAKPFVEQALWEEVERVLAPR